MKGGGNYKFTNQYTKNDKLFQVVWIICPLHSPHHPSIFTLSSALSNSIFLHCKPFFIVCISGSLQKWITLHCIDYVVLFCNFECFFYNHRICTSDSIMIPLCSSVRRPRQKTLGFSVT